MPCRLVIILLLITLSLSFIHAQSSELAATLEVLNAGVEVQRVNTANWIPVKIEAIVGVGDTIRTDATGEARITFFADGVETDLLPDTEYRIVEFEGETETFNLSVEVLAGQTLQRIGRSLNADSNYDVRTPAMALTARGTEFAVRVEDSGRSAMLVREGTVEATSEETETVPPAFGIRAEAGELSDVVRASTFEELDAGLDGCSASVVTPDDVSINVRVSPDTDAERIGVIDASEVNRFYGVTENGSWYRIAFEGRNGWILSTNATVDSTCAGLRQFADDYDGSAETGEALEVTPEATPES